MYIIHLVVLSIFLIGCGSENNSLVEVREVLNKTQWKLTSYLENNGSESTIIEGTQYFLDFDEEDDRVYIVLDCKDFVTTYSETNNRLEFDEIFSTQSECEFADSKLYNRQSSIIYRVLKSSVTKQQTKNSLILSYDKSKLFFTKAVDETILDNNYNVSKLIPFKSDGCSGFFDGNIFGADLWKHCCYEHDFAYWQGGTRQQKKDADLALKSCVEATGESAIAALMYEGVQVGGNPSFPTTYRWGFGWPYPYIFGELSVEQKLEVQKVSFK